MFHHYRKFQSVLADADARVWVAVALLHDVDALITNPDVVNLILDALSVRFTILQNNTPLKQAIKEI